MFVEGFNQSQAFADREAGLNNEMIRFDKRKWPAGLNSCKLACAM